MGRFNRQIILPEIGLIHQNTIQLSTVSIIGIGGLGCPVAAYLAAAGIGTLRLIDFDTVQLDNLNRQILFGYSDIGKLKSTSAAEKLQAQYSDIQLIDIPNNLDEHNASTLLSNSDLIVDCSDNFACRYISTKTAETLGIPLISGSLFRSEGQILGFNRQETGYKSYETLFPKSVTDLNNNNCETAGILGAMAGIVGAMMAIEAIKQLLDNPDKLTNEILIYRQNGPQIFRIKI